MDEEAAVLIERPRRADGSTSVVKRVDSLFVRYKPLLLASLVLLLIALPTLAMFQPHALVASMRNAKNAQGASASSGEELARLKRFASVAEDGWASLVLRSSGSVSVASGAGNLDSALCRAEDVYESHLARRLALHGVPQPLNFSSFVEVLVQMLMPTYPCPVEERVGNWGDGGKWVCMLTTVMQAPPVVYSIGSHEEFDFEEAVSSLLHTQPHTFDPFLSPQAVDHMLSLPFLHFHAVGLAADSEIDTFRGRSPEREWATLAGVTANLSHSFVDVLKMDCEGCEIQFAFDLMRATGEGSRKLAIHGGQLLFGQFLVEFHALKDPNITLSWLYALEAVGYRLFHFEANPQCPVCAEFAFIHKDLVGGGNLTNCKTLMTRGAGADAAAAAAAAAAEGSPTGDGGAAAAAVGPAAAAASSSASASVGLDLVSAALSSGNMGWVPSLFHSLTNIDVLQCKAEAAWRRNLDRRLAARGAVQTFNISNDVEMMLYTLAPSYACPMPERMGVWGEGGKWVCVMPTTIRPVPTVFSLSSHSLHATERAIAAAFTTQPAVEFKTLQEFTDAVGGSSSSNSSSYADVVALDCDGCEEQLIADLLKANKESGVGGTGMLRIHGGALPFGQILIHVFNIKRIKEVLTLFYGLESLGYRMFASEPNLHCGTCWEVAYVHQDLVKPNSATDCNAILAQLATIHV